MPHPPESAAVAPTHLSQIAILFMELGGVIVGLSILARIALRFGLTPIPLYLIAGLIMGKGGLHPLESSDSFIGTGSDIGVILLLFMLGLEYSASELTGSLRRGLKGGFLDAALNFTPGFLFALLLHWPFVVAILLGGVTWISSSSIIAKVLGDLGRLGNRETPPLLSILVMEDLAMALYLPLVAVLLLGQGFLQGFVSVSVALLTVFVVLYVALRHGERLSRVVSHESDEVVLLTIFGLVLLVAGVAQKLQVSSGVGAFLVGLAISGAVADRAHHLIGPLRDLFAATFFFFVGLSIDPKQLPFVLFPAFMLAVITSLTKVITGWQAAKWEDIAPRGRMRAGLALTSRGEFSVVIAGLGASAAKDIEHIKDLGPMAAAYVLILAVCGPVMTRFAENFSVGLERFEEWRETRRTLAAEAEPEEVEISS